MADPLSDPNKRHLFEQVVSDLLTIPYSPHSPYPKQAQFLLDFSLEALYGGAAGGGKSDALLMAALQFVEVPGYSALLLRKSFADLSQPGALMNRADEWLRGSGAKWNEQEHSWTFPSGARVVFGYIQNRNDRLKYQGAEYHFVGFDEVTQFKEEDYRYLFSRVRRVKTGNHLSRVPIRIRAATNPGGPGHNWVYNRFVRAYEDQHKMRAEIQGAVDLGQKSPLEAAEELAAIPSLPRNFYPATIADNPALDAEEYLRSLAELDVVTRAQLEAGNWNIRPEGRVFKRDWFEANMIDDNQLPNDVRWARYWDLAATDPNPYNDPDYTAGCLLGHSPRTGMWYLWHMMQFRHSPGEVETIVQDTAKRDKRDHGHVPIYIEQEPGASGKTVIHYYAKSVLRDYEVYGDSPTGNKIVRAQLVASKAQYGLVKVRKGGWWVGKLLDEIEVFPDGEHDDQVDALSGAFGRLHIRTSGAPIVNLAGKNEGLQQANRWVV